jgi:hypothetical protein
MIETETEVTSANAGSSSQVSMLTIRSLKAWLSSGAVASPSTGKISLQDLEAQYATMVKSTTGQAVKRSWFLGAVGSIRKAQPELLEMVADLSEGHPPRSAYQKSRSTPGDEISDKSNSPKTNTHEPGRKIRKLNDGRPLKLLSNSLRKKNIKNQTQDSKNKLKSKGKERQGDNNNNNNNNNSNNSNGNQHGENENKSSGGEGEDDNDDDDDGGDVDDDDDDEDDDEDDDDVNNGEYKSGNDNDGSDNNGKSVKRFSGRKIAGKQEDRYLDAFGGREEQENEEEEEEEKEEEEEEEEEGDEGNTSNSTKTNHYKNNRNFEFEGGRIEEEYEKELLMGKRIKDLVLADFVDPQKLKTIGNKNTLPKLNVPLHYRLANRYMELGHGPGNSFKPTKQKITNTARRTLFKQAGEFFKFWTTAGHFALPDKNSHLTATARARKIFVVKQQRSTQAAMGFVLEAMAQTMNEDREAVIPLLDSAYVVLADQMTAARRELQWQEDPELAKGLEEEPEDREQTFDEEDQEVIKKKNERQKQQWQMRRNAAATAGTGSGRDVGGRGRLFSRRSLSRGGGSRGPDRRFVSRQNSRTRQRGTPQTGYDYNRYDRAGSAGDSRRGHATDYSARTSANFGSNAWAGGGSNNSDSNYDGYYPKGPSNQRRGRGRGRK